MAVVGAWLRVSRPGALCGDPRVGGRAGVCLAAVPAPNRAMNVGLCSRRDLQPPRVPGARGSGGVVPSHKNTMCVALFSVHQFGS